jgi:hypothetical protein
VIFGFDFLLYLGRIGYACPTFFNFWLRDLCFHGRRRTNCGGRLLNFGRCGHDKLIALDFGNRAGLHRRCCIDILLALERQALDWSARLRAERVVIRTIIVNDVVVNRDVRHVHGLVDESNILRWRKDAFAQNRLTDVADVDEIVVGRTDIKSEVDVDADGLAFINDARAAWRQGRPTDYPTTMTP